MSTSNEDELSSPDRSPVKSPQVDQHGGSNVGSDDEVLSADEEAPQQNPQIPETQRFDHKSPNDSEHGDSITSPDNEHSASVATSENYVPQKPNEVLYIGSDAETIEEPTSNKQTTPLLAEDDLASVETPNEETDVQSAQRVTRKSSSDIYEIQSPSLEDVPNASGTNDKEKSPANDSLPTPTQAELFGDADDVSTSSDDDEKKPNESLHDHDESHDHVATAAEDREAEEELEAAAETLIEVEIPKIAADLGSQPYFVKFPNFLGVEPRPFDPDTYEDEVDDDDVLDEEGRSRVKLKVENTIRWKQMLDTDGVTLKRSSNAKVVRWSDGSMSLYLGNEVFDVHTHPLQGDHHHLFIRQGTGLQGKAIFRTKLTFRPHSTESFTHRKMTMSMADRTNKTQKVKVLPVVGKDPEVMKQELMKREEERLRASARRESQQRRTRERAHGRSLTAGYLEGDESDNDNSVSISAIKKRYKSGMKDIAAARAIYDSSEEDDAAGGGDSGDEDDDRSPVKKAQAEKRLERAKRLEDSDEDEEAHAATAEGSPEQQPQQAKRRAAIIDDDEAEADD